MPEQINRAWLKLYGGTTLVMHVNMGDRHLLTRRIVDRERGRPVGLSYTDVSYKPTKRNGEKGGTSARSWHVDSHEAAIDSLDKALEILAIVRVGDDPAEAHRHAG